MVRVYSQPAQGGNSSLGGIFGNSHQSSCMRLPPSDVRATGSSSYAEVDYGPPIPHPQYQYLDYPEKTHAPAPNQGQRAMPRSPPELRVPLHIGLCQSCSRLYKGAESRQGVYYDDLLNQKRRDEHKYRSGSDPYEPPHKSPSEGFPSRVAPPPNYPDTGLQDELDNLSSALNRLQGSVEPDANVDYSTDYGYSKSYPNSANANMEALGRKTWSAPNKDPFGAEELQKEMDKSFRRSRELDDPLQRNKSHSGQSYGGGYQPSFGNGGSNARVRRAGGNAAPPASDRGRYMQELEEQMQDQKRRKERDEVEAGMDWWEKKKPTTNEYKVPHPSQPSHQMPDPAEARKRYEQELKEQMDAKKRVDDENNRKEREEEDKLERRLREQQEKMKREFDEEMNKKKAKEDAKLRRQEELTRRQVELQQEADKAKKEADEKRHSEQRSTHRPRSRKPSAEPMEQPQGLNFRSDSPPIPTMRSNQREDVQEQAGDTGSQNTRPEIPKVVEQLQTMRQGLEKRQESLKGEDDFGAGWDGLAEL